MAGENELPTSSSRGGARKRMSVLVNTHSTRYPAEIEPLLAPLAASHDMTLVRVDRPKEFSQHIEAAARSSEVIVIGSGDGTLARSGHALIESGCTIGVLPFGNANDLARGLGMPLDIAAACRALADAEPRAIDVGLVNGHCFFNAAVIGLGAKVSAAMDASKKKRWKRFSQLPHFLSALLGRRSFALKVQTDAWTSRMRSIHFTVANGRTIGGGVTVDEEAWLDDGELDVSSVRPQSLSELLMLAPAMMTGRRRHHPQVDFMRRKSLRVETKRKMKVATDGDIVTETPADFECRPGALRFLVPREPEATFALAAEADEDAERSRER